MKRYELTLPAKPIKTTETIIETVTETIEVPGAGGQIYLVWVASWEGVSGPLAQSVWQTGGPPPGVAEYSIPQNNQGRGAALMLSGLPFDVGEEDVIWSDDCATVFSSHAVETAGFYGSFHVATSGYGNDGEVATITATYDGVTYTATVTMGSQS